MNFVLEAFYIIVICSGFSQANLCSEGYLDIGGICSPVCAEECPDTQICVEPNNCGCDDGYHLVGSKCTKKCEPKFFLINDTYCQPLCRHKCTNGFCAAPDTCQCNSGYQLNPLSKSCEPICNETCGSDAYCLAPNKCACKSGFHGNAMIACQPWCLSDCKNGECIGPNNCVCHEGFKKYNMVCIPKCSNGCRFGDCLPGDNCRCWEGLKFNKITGECEDVPIDITQIFGETTNETSTSIAVSSCSNNCHNGFCTSAGTCQCNQGFVKAGSTDCQVSIQNDSFSNEDCIEESICQNYLSSSTELTSSSSDDDSIHAISTTDDVNLNCQNGCWGGSCTDGICQCQEGLVLDHHTNDCIMPCEHNCQNGVCNQENMCECNQGFVLQNGSGCVPQCGRGCVNSICVAPIHCECFEGDISKLHLSSALSCLPTCEGFTGDLGCLNGTCVAVNKCQCDDGFVPKPGNPFECVSDYVHYDFFRRKIFYTILWSILLLALVIIILLGFLAQRRIRRVSYNVDKIENYRSTVMFQNYDQSECVL